MIDFIDSLWVEVTLNASNTQRLIETALLATQNILRQRFPRGGAGDERKISVTVNPVHFRFTRNRQKRSKIDCSGKIYLSVLGPKR